MLLGGVGTIPEYTAPKKMPRKGLFLLCGEENARGAFVRDSKAGGATAPRQGRAKSQQRFMCDRYVPAAFAQDTSLPLRKNNGAGA